MSFDLTFYKKDNQVLEEQGVRDYLDAHALRENVGFDGWLAQNPSTGAYFTIDYSPKNEETFEGFTETGISCNVNYCRPDFFGKEFSQFVSDLASYFNLFIFNPQDFNNGDFEKIGKDQLFEYTKDELFESYVNSNKNSIVYFKQQNSDIVVLQKEISDKCWEYNVSKDAIQEGVGENFFVPTLRIIQNNTTKEVMCVSMWSALVPTLLPTVTSHVLCPKLEKKLFGGFNDLGYQLIPFEVVKKTFTSARSEHLLAGLPFLSLEDVNDTLFYHHYQALSAQYSQVSFNGEDFSIVPMEHLVNY